MDKIINVLLFATAILALFVSCGTREKPHRLTQTKAYCVNNTLYVSKKGQMSSDPTFACAECRVNRDLKTIYVRSRSVIGGESTLALLAEVKNYRIEFE